MKTAACVMSGRRPRAGEATAQPAARPAKPWPTGEGISVLGPESEADGHNQRGAEGRQAWQARQTHLFSHIPLSAHDPDVPEAGGLARGPRIEIRLPVEGQLAVAKRGPQQFTHRIVELRRGRLRGGRYGNQRAGRTGDGERDDKCSERTPAFDPDGHEAKRRESQNRTQVTGAVRPTALPVVVG